MPPTFSSRSTSLRIVRMALLSGVVVFGAVVTYLVGQDGPRSTSPEVRAPLQWVNIGLLIASAAGVLVLQRIHAAERDPAKRQTWNIIAWALGEATAMFGGVHYLLVGSPAPYLVGLAMLVASFVLVPIRD
jgi:F0F1-type ATP synthase membrane subunit c/vacuolar-type H+-ATPase subunit K